MEHDTEVSTAAQDAATLGYHAYTKQQQHHQSRQPNGFLVEGPVFFLCIIFFLIVSAFSCNMLGKVYNDYYNHYDHNLRDVQVDSHGSQVADDDDENDPSGDHRREV